MTQIENEREILKHQLRYQPMDNFDLYELMLSEARLNAWKEFVDDLFNIIFHCK